MIPNEVLEFIKANKVSVLTTLLKDGAPHSASLHFAHKDDPLYFVFLTEKNSRKCQNLSATPTKGSLVIGFNPEEMKTLQLEGEVEMLEGEELEEGWKTYLTESPGAEKSKSNEAFTIIKFIPNWWRFTDLNFKPWKVIS